MKRWSAEALLEHPFLAGATEYRDNWIAEFARWKKLKALQKSNRGNPSSEESPFSKSSIKSSSRETDQRIIPETGIPKTPKSDKSVSDISQKAEKVIKLMSNEK